MKLKSLRECDQWSLRLVARIVLIMTSMAIIIVILLIIISINSMAMIVIISIDRDNSYRINNNNINKFINDINVMFNVNSRCTMRIQE
jgi:hypothetical protein